MWPFRVDTIYGADGEHDTPYLTRIKLGSLSLHIFHRGDADPDPHDHPYEFWTFPLTTYMEEVAEPTDEGMEWLLGVDPGVFVSQRVVKAFRLHHRPATYTHRVLYRTEEVVEHWDPDGYYRSHGSPVREWRQLPGPIVTLVWWSKKNRRNWGFLKLRDGRFCWQDWRQYVYEGGKHAPCEEESGDV